MRFPCHVGGVLLVDDENRVATMALTGWTPANWPASLAFVRISKGRGDAFWVFSQSVSKAKSPSDSGFPAPPDAYKEYSPPQLKPLPEVRIGGVVSLNGTLYSSQASSAAASEPVWPWEIVRGGSSACKGTKTLLSGLGVLPDRFWRGGPLVRGRGSSGWLCEICYDRIDGKSNVYSFHPLHLCLHAFYHLHLPPVLCLSGA